MKKHRKIWINRNKEDIDFESFKKNAQRLLNTCISLGPVYIKLGQWLSSRADVLPQPYMKELEKLQDDVPADPWEKIEPILENDLGPAGKIFDFFDNKPLSSASIGQVYHAKLNHQEVVVKIKRPEIETRVEEDLKVLKKFLPLGLRFVDNNLGFSAKAILAQFVETIHDEMDYTLESSNLKKIKKNLEKNNQVLVPSVYDEFSTKNVLTMEYLPGIKITDVKTLDEVGIDRKKLMIDVHSIFFTMLLRYPIFHADPHPGNISVSKDGKIILYDYGMTGGLDKETRRKLVRLYLGLIEKDPSRAVNAMDQLGMLKPGYNRALIEKAIELSIRAMHGRKPDDMELEAFTELANKTMGKFPFILPKELALYLRMASIIEGIYYTHKVDFKFAKVLRAVLEKENLVLEAYVEELKLSAHRFAESLDATLTIAPKLKKFLDDQNSLLMQNSESKSYNLLSGSILSSAIFIGSALLYPSNSNLSIAGMICSIVVISVFAKLKNR